MVASSLYPHSCSECKKIVIDGTGPDVYQCFQFTHGEVENSSLRCDFFRWTLKLLKENLHKSYMLVLYVSQDSEDLKALNVVWTDVDKSLLEEDTRNQGRLYFFSERKDFAALYIKSRPLEQSPARPSSLIRCLKHYKSCSNHKRCKAADKEKQNTAPTRLLDIRSNSQVRLYTVGREETPLYAALSYCWGSSQQQNDGRTTRENIQDRHGGIDICQLTQSIRDAVEVTRRLELSYLWVDALCIVQDDDMDVALEISKMRSVYRGATVTISAASAKDSTEGFLGDRDLKKAYGNLFQLRYRNKPVDGVGEGWVLLSEHPVTDTYEENIDERAWTMQEDMLSLRLLRFGSKQTTWRCRKYHPATRVDGGGFPVQYNKDTEFSVDEPYQKAQVQSDMLDLDSSCRPRVNDEWLRTVSEYTRRKIKEPSDRLPACAALAENYADIMGLDASEYLAGLWENDIYAQLLWYRPEEIVVERTYGPSWSWASTNGPIEFFLRRLLETNEIVDAAARYVGSYRDEIYGTHDYSEVGSGRLELNGRLQRAHWDSFSLRRSITNADTLPVKVHWDVSNGLSPQAVWCFEISRSKFSLGLLLIMKDHASFKRVGYFECDENEDSDDVMKSFFDEIEPQNVVLY